MYPDSGPNGGLSPRVRGNRLLPNPLWSRRRSIPAGAGEPSVPAMVRSITAVYPRGCGGTFEVEGGLIETKGLSPRVRGNLAHLS